MLINEYSFKISSNQSLSMAFVPAWKYSYLNVHLNDKRGNTISSFLWRNVLIRLNEQVSEITSSCSIITDIYLLDSPMDEHDIQPCLH